MKAQTKKILGIILIAAPVPGLVIVLAAYAISSFVISNIIAGSGGSDLLFLIGNLIRVTLSFLGLICVAGIIVGVPTGMVLLVTSGESDDKKESK
ncbi:MAG: hypothetical protein ABH846_02815, partial [Patescibacteria group bacterium]